MVANQKKRSPAAHNIKSCIIKLDEHAAVQIFTTVRQRLFDNIVCTE